VRIFVRLKMEGQHRGGRFRGRGRFQFGHVVLGAGGEEEGLGKFGIFLGRVGDLLDGAEAAVLHDEFAQDRFLWQLGQGGGLDLSPGGGGIFAGHHHVRRADHGLEVELAPGVDAFGDGHALALGRLGQADQILHPALVQRDKAFGGVTVEEVGALDGAVDEEDGGVVLLGDKEQHRWLARRLAGG